MTTWSKIYVTLVAILVFKIICNTTFIEVLQVLQPVLHSVDTPPQKMLKKGEGLTRSRFLEGVAGKEGVTFFKRV